MKKQLLTLSLAIASLSFIAQDLSNGLLLHYDFNGNANDISGNGMHATVNGATLTTDKDGNANSAYSFDGVDDFIELPNDASLKPQLPLTFAVKFKINDINKSAFHTLINTDLTLDTYNGSWMGVSDEGHLTVVYGNGIYYVTNSTTRQGLTTDPGVIGEGVWYSLVGIMRAKDDMELWIDCVEEPANYSGASGGNNPVYNTSVLTAGGIGVVDAAGQDPAYSSQTISEIRYWNRDLTQVEIESLCPSSVSVFENKNKELIKGVYPNPSSGDFTIKMNTVSNVDIQIVDVAGRVIMEFKEYAKSELKVNDLNEGLYFVKISNQENQLTKRIIVSE